MGAYDFYQKPVESDVINVIVARAFAMANIEHENRSMRSIAGTDTGIIGNSTKMDRLRQMIQAHSSYGNNSFVVRGKWNRQGSYRKSDPHSQ